MHACHDIQGTLSMKRRNFFGASAALAVAGIAGVSKAKAAAPTKSTTSTQPRSPSIFDFGAVGDGVTDDSAAFSKALQAAATQGHIVIVPSFTYAIAQPITFSSTNDIGQAWGLECQGARLLSKITTGVDVMSLTSNNTVRYFRLTGGLTITGSGSDGNGLHIFAPGSSVFFYNATIDGLSVEGVGKHGLLLEGNVFESSIYNSFFQDCKQNGATFAQSQGGVVSAINVISCFFNQNGNYGLAATNFDAEYGGTTDVRVYGGYCRDNQGYGFYYNNGGGPIENVGFENNCRSLQPGDPNGAHVYGLVSMGLRNCTGFNMYGGATYLLRGWWVALTTLEGCAQDAGGAMAATGASRVTQVNGDSGGHVLMRACSGGLDAVSGTACTWAAECSSGPSPLGPLNIRGTVSDVTV